ncbi:IclR family transcriptional regulator [Altererythrobacter sp.]|uniref:IclR family transcriptional regulator n=1 Tax=Altererythrobacter sp. TaxID=1872480 RepID=UPI003D013C05
MTTSDRVLNILSLFSLDKGIWTVEEAAQQLDLTVSTAYRYFRSLVSAGLVVADEPGRYSLGPAIIHLDRQMRLHDPLITTAQPIMADMASELGENNVLLLARLYRSQVMCVHQEFVVQPRLAVSYERGRPIPLHRGAASKAILAYLPSRAMRQVKADSDVPEDVWKDLQPQLRQIRSRGYSLTESEIDPGMRGISAPILAPDQSVIGSLSIAAEATVQSAEELERSIQLIIRGCKLIEAALAVRAASREHNEATP